MYLIEVFKQSQTQRKCEHIFFPVEDYCADPPKEDGGGTAGVEYFVLTVLKTYFAF